jgi:hypothetical protein
MAYDLTAVLLVQSHTYLADLCRGSGAWLTLAGADISVAMCLGQRVRELTGASSARGLLAWRTGCPR